MIPDKRCSSPCLTYVYVAGVHVNMGCTCKKCAKFQFNVILNSE